MPLQFLPDISFDSAANQKFTDDVHQSIAEVDGKLNDIGRRVEILNRKFDDLQVLADDVAERYERTSRKHGGRIVDGIDRRSLLQPILDHNFEIEDIHLLCRYIRCIFNVILKLIHKKVSNISHVKSLITLHKARPQNKELSRAYNEVAEYLKIDNSGKPETFIIILHSFLTDHKNLKENDTPKAKPSPSGVMSSEVLTNESLSSRLLADYALDRISTHVQNVNLAKELKCCVYTVYNVYASIL